MNDLKKPEPITQENLPAALESGRITQKQVDEIWRETSFLSAQTPIEFRVAVMKLGRKLDPLMTLVLSQMMDIRAAMTKDTSTFHHLVAGTETIVKTLQQVNPLKEKLQRQEDLIDALIVQLDRSEAKLDVIIQALAEGGKIEVKHEVLHGGDEEAEFLAQTAADAINSQTAEPTEEPYDGNVGSAWDPKNPAQPPVTLPTASEEYETQSKAFRERILKHS
jgi:hypothetical protein